MSAIEKYVPEDNEIDRIQRIADNFARSGYFADAREALQAFVKISAGAEMGLQPFVSMSGIAIIQGKPVVGAGILAGLLDDHPDFDYTVTWEPNPAAPTACTVTVFKNGKERGASRFSMEDAAAAGLAGKDVWKKFQRNMLYARAMSNAVAWYAPSVTRSNGRVFVEGELTDDEPATPIPAPRRKRERSAAPPITSTPPETIVDAEVVVDAPGDVTPVESQRATEQPEAEPASTTTSNPDWNDVKAAKVMLASLSEDEKEAVYEACDQLEIKRTVNALVERFGSMTAKRETFLPAIAAAVNPPEKIDGEVGNGSAAAFDEFIAEDTAAQSIARAEESRARTSAKLAAAGEFGS